jgi:hypothetical protein
MSTFNIDKEISCLLEDFSKFVGYLNSNEVTIGKATKYIGAKFLYEVNQLMSIKAEGVTPKSTQLAYPLLYMFHNLSISGKLFLEEVENDKKIVLRPTDRLNKFNGLSSTEKYIFLLEILWVDCSFENLRYQSYDDTNIYATKMILMDFVNRKPNEVIYANETLVGYSTILLYFSYFGILVIKEDEEEKLRDIKTRRFIPKRILISKMGLELITILHKKRALELWNIPFIRESGEWRVEFKEKFHVPFKKLFDEGELENTLPRNKSDIIDGIYTFKASLSKNVWSKIRLSAHHTLYDLHDSIQAAFDLDDEHMFSFFMDGKAGSSNRFACPHDERGPYVDEARIGELDLYKKQKFLYLFDYSDEWRFDVEVLDIEEINVRLLNPEILETIGDIPRQYPDFNEKF